MSDFFSWQPQRGEHARQGRPAGGHLLERGQGHDLVQGAVRLLGHPGAQLRMHGRQRRRASAARRAGRHGLLGAPAAQELLDQAGADLKGSGGLLHAHLLLLDRMHDTTAQIFRIGFGHDRHDLEGEYLNRIPPYTQPETAVAPRQATVRHAAVG